MSSGYRPRAKSRAQGNTPYGKLSENRVAWAQLAGRLIAILRYSHDEIVAQVKGEDGAGEAEVEPGDSVRVFFTNGGGAKYSLNLTAMTHAEFKATKDLMTLAFRMAEPTVIERDRRAEEAYANGDDTFSRSYRPVPQFVVRARSFVGHDQSVLLGLEDAIDRPAVLRDSDGGLRDESPQLAAGEPADREPEDDGQAAD